VIVRTATAIVAAGEADDVDDFEDDEVVIMLGHATESAY